MVNGGLSVARVEREKIKLGIAHPRFTIYHSPFTNDMPITESDIKKIAALAHLEITDDELRTLAPQIASIVDYVEQLDALDTRRVEPAIGGLTPEGERTHAVREDATRPSLGQGLRPHPA